MCGFKFQKFIHLMPLCNSKMNFVLMQNKSMFFSFAWIFLLQHQSKFSSTKSRKLQKVASFGINFTILIIEIISLAFCRLFFCALSLEFKFLNFETLSCELSSNFLLLLLLVLLLHLHLFFHLKNLIRSKRRRRKKKIII